MHNSPKYFTTNITQKSNSVNPDLGKNTGFSMKQKKRKLICNQRHNIPTITKNITPQQNSLKPDLGRTSGFL